MLYHNFEIIMMKLILIFWGFHTGVPISNATLFFVFPEDLCLRILAEFQVIHPAIPAAVRNMSGELALAS